MWGSGIDLSAPDPGNELTVSRQMNRLDQIRIVVLDVPDARAHRPADHVVGRVGGEKCLQIRHVGRLLTQPVRPRLGLQPEASAETLSLEDRMPHPVQARRKAPIDRGLLRLRTADKRRMSSHIPAGPCWMALWAATSAARMAASRRSTRSPRLRLVEKSSRPEICRPLSLIPR